MDIDESERMAKMLDVETWCKPKTVQDAHLAFGGDISDLMPPYEDVEQYGHSPANEVTSHWFFHGLPPDTQFMPREGVDAVEAIRHIKAILRSWEPKHEHKEAGVSFLLCCFFEWVKLEGHTYRFDLPTAGDGNV